MRDEKLENARILIGLHRSLREWALRVRCYEQPTWKKRRWRKSRPSIAATQLRDEARLASAEITKPWWNTDLKAARSLRARGEGLVAGKFAAEFATETFPSAQPVGSRRSVKTKCKSLLVRPPQPFPSPPRHSRLYSSESLELRFADVVWCETTQVTNRLGQLIRPSSRFFKPAEKTCVQYSCVNKNRYYWAFSICEDFSYKEERKSFF